MTWTKDTNGTGFEDNSDLGLEFICTGNNGRSPMAEAIAKEFIRQRKWTAGKFRITSSGTKASPEYDENLTFERACLVYEVGSRFGLLKSQPVDEDAFNTDPEYQTAIKANVSLTLSIIRRIESAYRDAALHNTGLTYDGERTQTTARKDVTVCLGMEEKHVQQAIKIYSDLKHPPKIDTITHYVNVDGEIPDSIGNPDPKVYEAIRDRLTDIMPGIMRQFYSRYGDY